jgi:adenylate kinase family enzyme
VLGAGDPLPGRPRRVLVAGASGSGKTTLARRLSAVLGVPHVEIDALRHGPGWEPREAFEADVDAFSSGPEWVTEWQYDQVRGTLALRADLLVWLDLPRRVVMRQVVLRTVRRRLRREELWNGNTEPPLHELFTDPEHVVRWAWSSYGWSAQRVTALPDDLTVVRLRSRRETRRWLAGPLRDAARASS